MGSPALSLFDKLVERGDFDEVAVQLRAQELQAPEVHLLLNLVLGGSRDLPQVEGGLEEDVDVALVAAVSHELRLLEEVARLLLFLLEQVNLPQVEKRVGRAASEPFLRGRLQSLAELPETAIDLPHHRLAVADVGPNERQI